MTRTTGLLQCCRGAQPMSSPGSASPGGALHRMAGASISSGPSLTSRCSPTCTCTRTLGTTPCTTRFVGAPLLCTRRRCGRPGACCMAPALRVPFHASTLLAMPAWRLSSGASSWLPSTSTPTPPPGTSGTSPPGSPYPARADVCPPSSLSRRARLLPEGPPRARAPAHPLRRSRPRLLRLHHLMRPPIGIMRGSPRQPRLPSGRPGTTSLDLTCPTTSSPPPSGCSTVRSGPLLSGPTGCTPPASAPTTAPSAAPSPMPRAGIRLATASLPPPATSFSLAPTSARSSRGCAACGPWLVAPGTPRPLTRPQSWPAPAGPALAQTHTCAACGPSCGSSSSRKPT